jgi:hypothetical protein
MKSTPPVFCTPAVNVVSTPSISTPLIFQQDSYPWALKTPEASPMCWGLAPGVPSSGYPKELSPEPVVSRELLQRVCEPFFDQMLTALQQALQQTPQTQDQQHQQQQQQHQQCSEMVQKGAYSQPLFFPNTRQWSHLDPMLDEESTEAEEIGAFASLLSSLPSEAEGMDDVEAKSPEAGVLALVSASHTSNEDSEQASDSEKSSMVCRHWKTKGWCRMESNCKFLHPERHLEGTWP